MGKMDEVDQSQLYLTLMYFELPWNLDVRTIQRQMIHFWTDYLVRMVRTAAA